MIASVCLELFHTERAHVRNLKVMQQLYYRPMKEVSDSAILAEFVSLLFPNIDDMIELHGKLPAQLMALFQIVVRLAFESCHL